MRNHKRIRATPFALTSALLTSLLAMGSFSAALWYTDHLLIKQTALSVPQQKHLQSVRAKAVSLTQTVQLQTKQMSPLGQEFLSLLQQYEQDLNTVASVNNQLTAQNLAPVHMTPPPPQVKGYTLNASQQASLAPPPVQAVTGAS